MLGPREPVQAAIRFGAHLTDRNIDAYFATTEARFPDLTPGIQKRVVWAGQPAAKTPLAVVYLHGFSATSQEIRPVPDRVAKALNANLIYTRLTGHGQDGAALATATAGDWINDTAEALAAGRAVGDKVIVMATSTGGTLAALVAVDPALSEDIKGIVFISPNFAIANPVARILTWPGVRWWGPIVAGASRSFEASNADHARFWTNSYPTVAVLPMAALVKYAVAQDFRATDIPALFVFSDADTVVDERKTRAVAARWGGPVTLAPQDLPPGNDPYNHVIAGDILSPGMTGPVTTVILDWVNDLRP